MAAITSALIAIAGIGLAWLAMEIACKPCLEKGREAIDRSLDPNFDPDDRDIHTPLNQPQQSTVDEEAPSKPAV
ncbi:hypothetical protein AMTRI_Chr02g253900 [Amborella trichopoda]|uniref:Outer envelope membrane protein 7 n=1 Tax=Amborella trichopoda TaxID=13333 RepID=W1NVK6_AMBTC|nr:outer envelope membrane protein 7 [Amborella trichopoda]ERM99290.1 hypothetical protein AMTR_s00092p00166500 [Amborella trichopoda]|eukprot:XP_011620806.1 outer envelope membrane protein 7 [Amborella trichopoda]